MYLHTANRTVLREEHAECLLRDMLRQASDVDVGSEGISCVVRAGEHWCIFSSYERTE